MKKKVYVGLTCEVLHHGHIKLLEAARTLGDVTVGLLTDSAVTNHKRVPYLTWEQRKIIIENIVGVSDVVPQNEWGYHQNILKYKPDFFVHGDDWKENDQVRYRELTIEALNSYGGKLVEHPYTKGVSTTNLLGEYGCIGSSVDIRRRALRRLINSKGFVRLLETHSPISALIAESARVINGDEIREFDGFWSSSLTDSTEMGKPDTESLDLSARFSNVNNIFDVTTKPLLFDADTGGLKEHFQLNIKTMERLGISGVIIEDKTGLKKNSLFGNDVAQSQDDVDSFCEKIRMGKEVLQSPDFLLIARIESLILDKGMDDALNRANAYVAAGADAIMIHSRKSDGLEIREFCLAFRQPHPSIPIVVVPTSFNHIKEDEFREIGVNVVIYANHMMRAAYPAMLKTATSILTNQRTYEVENSLMSVNGILELIPGTK